MTPLRRKMIEDMELAGLAAATRESYVWGVCGLAQHYGRSPEALTEAEVRAYFLHLIREKRVAKGTFKRHRYGARFLYLHTLHRDWALFKKGVFASPSRNACPPRSATTMPLASSLA